MAGRSTLALGIAALSLAAVAAALVSQHVFDMQPCPWCVLQRLIFVAIAAVALLGLLVAQRLAAAGVILLTLLGAAAVLWQHFVAALSQSCNLTLADRIVSGLGIDRLLPDVFAVRASCADAAVDLLGIPYEFWSLGLYVVLAVAALRWLLRRRGRARHERFGT